MGKYETVMAEEKDIKDLLNIIRHGYYDGKTFHRPNPQLATIIILQANLGCRIGDIVNLKTSDFIYDGYAWKLDLIEQKTGKKRNFIVPAPIKEIIDEWTYENSIYSGRLFNITSQCCWKHMRAASAYLGLKDFSFHSIRKLAGLRTYYASGKDIALTCQFYQHSSPTISSHYLKRSSKQMDEALTKAVFLA